MVDSFAEHQPLVWGKLSAGGNPIWRRIPASDHGKQGCELVNPDPWSEIMRFGSKTCAMLAELGRNCSVLYPSSRSEARWPDVLPVSPERRPRASTIVTDAPALTSW